MKELLGLLLLGVIVYVIWAWNSIFFDTALLPDPPNYDGDDNYPADDPSSANSDKESVYEPEVDDRYLGPYDKR